MQSNITVTAPVAGDPAGGVLWLPGLEGPSCAPGEYLPVPSARRLARPRRPALPPWLRIVRERPPNAESGATRQRAPVRTPGDAHALLTPRLASEEVETFVVLALDCQHRVIAVSEVSRGIVNTTLVAPREVFRLAVVLGASAIIVAHNHPSGDSTPSADDRAVTAQLVAAGRALDIPVHDHVIVGDGRYTSLAAAGLL